MRHLTRYFYPGKINVSALLCRPAEATAAETGDEDMSKAHVDVCLNFHQSHARLRLQLDEELGLFHGIDFDDFALLYRLAAKRGEPLGFGLLATELGSSRSALLRRIRPLEKIGLVACEGGVADRRISLRPASLRVIQAARDTVANVCDKLAFIDGMKKLGQLAAAPEAAQPCRTSAGAQW